MISTDGMNSYTENKGLNKEILLWINNRIKIDKDYAEWVQGLSKRFRNMQIKAATKVNREMLMFYWSLGKDIVELKSENKWGSGFLKNLSQDLTDALPN